MIALNFNPFPELYTERLILRQMVPADATAVQKLRSGEGLKYLPHLAEKSLAEHVAWIDMVNGQVARNQTLQWAITLKEQPGNLIGTLCLWNIDVAAQRGELGYHLAIDQQRKGIMSEALTAVISLSKSMGFATLEAFTMPYNEPSIELLKKFGFVHDSTTEARVSESELNGNAVYTLVL